MPASLSQCICVCVHCVVMLKKYLIISVHLGKGFGECCPGMQKIVSQKTEASDFCKHKKISHQEATDLGLKSNLLLCVFGQITWLLRGAAGWCRMRVIPPSLMPSAISSAPSWITALTLLSLWRQPVTSNPTFSLPVEPSALEDRWSPISYSMSALHFIWGAVWVGFKKYWFDTLLSSLSVMLSTLFDLMLKLFK